jgi:hypothetical protein
MKERPILFCGEMIKALIEGRKTQTRRIIKDYQQYACLTGGCPHDSSHQCAVELEQSAPLGKPGDRLWVRENFAIRGICCGMKPSEAAKFASKEAWVYEADNPTWSAGWRPSIHMPRVASRLTLELTAVRAERLQDISFADAAAEGVWTWELSDAKTKPGETLLMHENVSSVDKYRDLWNSINGPGSWDKNPWVWCYSFKKL